MAFFGAYMKIYWTKQKADSKTLAAAALKLYCGASDALCHNDRGRPYFKNTDIRISISHSGGIWLCALSGSEAGIDIERITDRNHLKIAERFFTPEETDFVKANGADGFFRLWVRKEAYVKYMGEGISYGLDSFSLSDGSRLADEYGDSVFREIDFGENFKCAVCTAKEEFSWEQIKTEEMHI